MKRLQEMILEALEGVGYDVIGAVELWNIEYYPLIKSLPAGRHIITIGKYEITFKKESR